MEKDIFRASAFYAATGCATIGGTEFGEVFPEQVRRVVYHNRADADMGMEEQFVAGEILEEFNQVPNDKDILFDKPAEERARLGPLHATLQDLGDSLNMQHCDQQKNKDVGIKWFNAAEEVRVTTNSQQVDEGAHGRLDEG